jgi:transcriptional regulator with XRE-family HTH domain
MHYKKNRTISNLNTEWEAFSRANKVTRRDASQQLGWSDSFFGAILRGESNLSLENLIKISNYLEISPTRIDPDYLTPKF